MSIQAPLVFLKEGAAVYTTRVPIGYLDIKPDHAIVDDAILTCVMARTFMKRTGKTLPDYDQVVIRIGERKLAFDRYAGLDPIYMLEDAGAPTEHLIAQVKDLMAGLAALEATRETAIAGRFALHYLGLLEQKLKREQAQ